MSDFSDAPFIAGSLFGVRAFAVDTLGRLHGPSFRQVFRPGENEAECRRGELALGGLTLSSLMHTYAVPSPGRSESALRRALGLPAAKRDDAPEPEPEVKPESTVHRVGQQDCTCGFYAYFDGGNDYMQSDRLTAIIEGYGRCTVGTRGFRAEKAKLTALVIRPKRRDSFALALRNYPDVPVFDRLKDALAEHPISAEQIPSPDDADFWTRPIR